MTTTLAPTPAQPDTAPGERLDHLYCCNPDLALCGTDIGDASEIAPDSDITCIVCADLEDEPCSPGCSA
ncbi:hypothetical protein [Streptomyces cyaneofuscatus]|uniref:hypothetical protein n=1 Tax=Streptomyces cyaneofuscatus TaxID=66883 RepID=UPI0036F111EC